jgi:hypothetical protein
LRTITTELGNSNAMTYYIGLIGAVGMKWSRWFW